MQRNVKMLKHVLTIALWLTAAFSSAQDKLDEYLRIGLSNNLVLREQNIDLQKSVLALKEAKKMFLPTVNFVATYHTAEGGREITFPAGDLMNPVYTTLNQLTSSHGFTQISNVEEQLFPSNFYDTRLHITYPLLNRDLFYSRSIRKQEISLKQYEIEIYKQQLIKAVRQAYFEYCSAKDGVNIYQSAYILVQQNRKVNQSLVNNGRGLPANLLRAESEVEAVYSKIIEANNLQLNAMYLFNFLLNRPLSDSIVFEAINISDSVDTALTDIPIVNERPELKRIKIGLDINELQSRMYRSYAVPKLHSFLDLGSQAADFKVNKQSGYYFFGLQLDMPIFNGNKNQIRVLQTSLEKNSLQLRELYLENQLQLAAQAAQNNVRSALASYKSSQKQVVSARAYFNLIEKGYKEGVNSIIEFLDARNQLTTAEIQVNISKYKVLSQIAEYEYQINNKNY